MRPERRWSRWLPQSLFGRLMGVLAIGLMLAQLLSAWVAVRPHDLKTPLTRMRLRTELLDDEEARARFESDLQEMEAMATQTLEFMRGAAHRKTRRGR